MAFTIFANASTATGAQLDSNFGEIAAMAQTPCGVTGVNSISLTPNVNAPTVASYVNYQAFVGIAASDNTGPVTAGVGSLSSIPVYKDSPSGPVLLTGGEIQAGNLVSFTYDSGLGGGGGFHLQTGINSSAGTFLPLGGGTLTGPLAGTSLTLSGDAAARNVSLTGGLTGVSVTATQATIGSGTPIKGVISTTVSSVVFPTIAPQSSADQSSPFSSLAVNDTVMLGLPSLTAAGVSFNAFASPAGTVVLRAFNVTASTITGLTLATVRFTAMKF